MKLPSKKYLLVALIALPASVFILAGLAGAIRDKGLASSEAAGWVQAIGSIAAIIGSFLIARDEVRESERRRTEELFQIEADLCRTALLLSMEATNALASFKRKLDPLAPLPPNIGFERVEEVLFALRGLGAKSLTFKIHAPILDIQRELAYTLTAIRQINSGGGVNMKRVEKADARFRAVVQASNSLYNLAKTRYRLPEVMLPSLD